MESEKVKEIKAKEFLEILCYKYKDVKGWEITKLQLMNILTLINELESENKRQKQANKKVINIIYSNNEENKQLKERIAELEKENKILQGTKERLTFADRKKLVDNAVEIKLKQFAEKLKEEIPDESTFGYLGYNGVMEVIDETLKEFLGK